MKDKLTCSKCRKHPNVQWQRLKERSRESFQALKPHSRIGKGAAGAKAGRRMALQVIFQGKRGHRN